MLKNRIRFYQIDRKYKNAFKEIFPSIRDDSLIHYEKIGTGYYCIKYLKKEVYVQIHKGDQLYKRVLLKDLKKLLMDLKVKKKVIDFIMSNEIEKQSHINGYFIKFRRNGAIIDYVLDRKNTDYLIIGEETIKYSALKKSLLKIKRADCILVGPFAFLLYGKENEYQNRFCVLKKTIKIGDLNENNKERRNN